MDTNASFSYKDLLLRKLSYAVICSVFSQLILFNAFVFFSNIDLFHPLQWILVTFKTLISFTTWLFVIPFLTIIFAQSVICAKDYVVKSTYCSTRFQKFISVFSIHNLVLLLLHIVVGAMLVWMFLNIGGGAYQNLIDKRENGYSLNEGTFYLIFSGFWTGFYFFVKVYISEKHLTFPVIQQRKFLQLKSEILDLIGSSILSSIWPAIYYMVLYYIWGSPLAKSCSRFLGLLHEDTVGLQCYIYLGMFTALYYFNMHLMRFYFNLFLTEPVEFRLVKTQPDSITLQESLIDNKWPIIQNLACLDLYLLARWSKVRRQVFFSLSQPGGHPHNWNSLIQNVLKLFSEYTESLNKSTSDIKIDKHPQSLPSTSTPQSSIQPFSPDRFRNLRNMSLYSPRAIDCVTITQSPVSEISYPDMLFKKLMEKIRNFYNFMKIILGINFLFGELPQANIQKCLANGHLIIWASQGIADITTVSLTEDNFGIVQKDLPAIITSLVHLKQSLDKLNKVPALTRRIAGYNDFNYRMKGAVNSAVKRSLFNICLHFGTYLKDFPLNKDVIQYIQTFVTIKH